MKLLTVFEMWYGRNEPPPEVLKLKAGHLDVEFEGGSLCNIRLGEHEIIRRIYSAVRDVNWNTIPPRMSSMSVQSGPDSFTIQFDVSHHVEALEFHWHALLEGTPDGTIRYVMDGAAATDFRYCRIGFCVLHPVAGTAGSRYRATTPGGEITGTLPKLVEPQRVENGFETPIFPSFSSLTIDMPGGVQVTADFEGDLFEMEDQRNWTDGSFKTYCTPIALGYPHSARAGQPFHQEVTIRAQGPAAAEGGVSQDIQPLRLVFGDAPGQRLPHIGFGLPDDGGEMSARESERIRQLQPDHLRVEIDLCNATWPASLDRAVRAAHQLDTTLELVLFLPDDPEPALEALAQELVDAPVARIIVFNEMEAPLGTTSPRWLHLARQHLGAALPGVPFVGGTNGNFAELNRQPPDSSAMDGVAYTINPQVHLPDERTLVEALEAQYDTVITAHSFSDGLPISISAVTLKPPFNQAATEEEATPDPDELPPSVDPRQMSLFSAAWTVGSLRSLGLAGADSITYYETTGWRGLMEAETGSRLPAKFNSFPGMLFPVYWVFAFLAELKGASMLSLTSSPPLLVEALALVKDQRLYLAIANVQPTPQEVVISPLPDGGGVVRRLNEDTFMLAAQDAGGFLKQAAEPCTVSAGQVTLNLRPYETTFAEFSLH